MHQLDIALAVVGALVLVLGLLSNLLRKSVLSENLLAVLLGILLGPLALGWLDLTTWGDRDVIVEQAARLSLAIGLIGVALRLPKRDYRRYWRPMALLVAAVMPLMWVMSSLIVYLLLDLPLWVAVLIGAIITPTDPIAASSIVTGELAERSLPRGVREILSGESGMNDGLAHPFVALALLMLVGERALFPHFITHVLLWQVGGAIAVGALLGYAAGRLLEWAEEHHAIEQISYLGYTLALSVTTLGAASLAGTESILAVFVAGVTFNMAVRESDRVEEERIQEAVNRFFTLPIFVLFGLVIPWADWAALGWTGLAVVVAVLLLRRLPAMLALRPLLGSLGGWRDTLFLGWFGPMAIAALYYASVAVQRAGLQEVWTVATLVVFASVVVHGITASPLTRRYAKS